MSLRVGEGWALHAPSAILLVEPVFLARITIGLLCIWLASGWASYALEGLAVAYHAFGALGALEGASLVSSLNSDSFD